MKLTPVRFALLSAGLTTLIALSGCISAHETVYSDIERTKVSFASDRAGRVFYETLSKAPAHDYRTEKRSSVNLLFVDVEQRTITGPNRLFNDAVAFCDTNQDGAISETEADLFASAWPLAKR